MLWYIIPTEFLCKFLNKISLVRLTWGLIITAKTIFDNIAFKFMVCEFMYNEFLVSKLHDALLLLCLLSVFVSLKQPSHFRSKVERYILFCKCSFLPFITMLIYVLKPQQSLLKYIKKTLSKHKFYSTSFLNFGE